VDLDGYTKDRPMVAVVELADASMDRQWDHWSAKLA